MKKNYKGSIMIMILKSIINHRYSKNFYNSQNTKQSVLLSQLIIYKNFAKKNNNSNSLIKI